MSHPAHWHVRFTQSLAKLPGQATTAYPGGVPFVEVFSHGSLSVELFAPKGQDVQQPHTRDEWYIVVRGTSHFERGSETVQVQAGDFLFVPAQMPHRFVEFSHDFAVWVGFYGPAGGEAA
jgi:mannose-6-phosphate isomerase-like protein (cupin superfamily)